MVRSPYILTLLCACKLPLVAADPTDTRSRAYELEHPDLSKSFDLRLSAFGGRSYDTKSSKTRSFFFWQKTQPKEFQTREFSGTKTSWLSKLPFFAKSAETKGKYELAFKDKKVESRSIDVADSRDANKALPVRALPGGDRPYVGPETERAAKPIPPTRPPDGWQGNLTEIKTIEEVRELLNKNK